MMHDASLEGLSKKTLTSYKLRLASFCMLAKLEPLFLGRKTPAKTCRNHETMQT